MPWQSISSRAPLASASARKPSSHARRALAKLSGPCAARPPDAPGTRRKAPASVVRAASGRLMQRSALAGDLLFADRPRLLARFEALDDRIDALLLDLRAEVGAVAIDVTDAVDDHVPGLPALRRHVHVVVDGD